MLCKWPFIMDTQSTAHPFFFSDQQDNVESQGWLCHTPLAFAPPRHWLSVITRHVSSALAPSVLLSAQKIHLHAWTAFQWFKGKHWWDLVLSSHGVPFGWRQHGGVQWQASWALMSEHIMYFTHQHPLPANNRPRVKLIKAPVMVPCPSFLLNTGI